MLIEESDAIMAKKANTSKIKRSVTAFFLHKDETWRRSHIVSPGTGPVMMKMEQGTPDGGEPQVRVEFGGPMMIKEAGSREEQIALDKAITRLRTALDNPSTPPGDIKEQLTAVRIAREKARRELTDAQADLTKILTVRQEAQLVLMGQLN
jgi:hypothetical protein